MRRLLALIRQAGVRLILSLDARAVQLSIALTLATRPLFRLKTPIGGHMPQIRLIISPSPKSRLSRPNPGKQEEAISLMKEIAPPPPPPPPPPPMAKPGTLAAADQTPEFRKEWRQFEEIADQKHRRSSPLRGGAYCGRVNGPILIATNKSAFFIEGTA